MNNRPIGARQRGFSSRLFVYEYINANTHCHDRIIAMVGEKVSSPSNNVKKNRVYSIIAICALLCCSCIWKLKHVFLLNFKDC